MPEFETKSSYRVNAIHRDRLVLHVPGLHASGLHASGLRAGALKNYYMKIIRNFARLKPVCWLLVITET